MNVVVTGISHAPRHPDAGKGREVIFFFGEYSEESLTGGRSLGVAGAGRRNFIDYLAVFPHG